jgi:hypothetical protein
VLDMTEVLVGGVHVVADAAGVCCMPVGCAILSSCCVTIQFTQT